MFFERQKLGAKWLRWLYFIATASAVIIMIFSLSNEEDKGFAIGMIVVFLLFIVGTYVLVFEIPALTRITQRGIEIKYRPWIWNWKVFSWDDIKSVSIQSINPVQDFGGWGYRFTLKGKRGVIMNNEPGVKVELKNGKIFVVTTNRQAELMRVVSRFLNEEGLDG